MVSHPEGPQALAYLKVAEAVLAKLGSAAGAGRKPFPKIVFENQASAAGARGGPVNPRPRRADAPREIRAAGWHVTMPSNGAPPHLATR